MAVENAAVEPAFPQVKRRGTWLILGAMLLAALLPLPLLMQSLWLDEASSVWFARLPVSDLLFRLCDPHPPGYYLLLKGWLAPGETEAWLRLPSVLASVAAVVLTARAGRSILGAKAGVLAALLLVTFPLQSWYAAEVRMYALAQALGVALLLSAWQLLTDGPQESHRTKHQRWWALAAFWLLAFTALAVDVSALLPFGALQLWWLARGRPRPRRWLLLQAAVLVPIALWGLIRPGGADTYHAVFVAVQARRLGIPLDPQSAGRLLLSMAVAGGTLAVAAAWHWQDRLRRVADQPWMAWLLLAFWLLLLAFSGFPRLFSVKRLLVVILPLLALLVSYQLARLRPHAVWLMAALGLAVTMWMLASFQREPWREAVATVLKHDPANAVVWVDEMAVPAFDYYARRVAGEQEDIPWTPLWGNDLPALPALTPAPAGDLWLVLAESPYRDLRALLPGEFHQQYQLVAEWRHPGIGLWRYRRLTENLALPPALPPPAQETLWGLQLPSPLAICR